MRDLDVIAIIGDRVLCPQDAEDMKCLAQIEAVDHCACAVFLTARAPVVTDVLLRGPFAQHLHDIDLISASGTTEQPEGRPCAWYIWNLDLRLEISIALQEALFRGEMAGGKAWHVLRMPPRRVGGVHRVLHALAGWPDLNGQGSIRDGERIDSQTKITRVHKNYICTIHAKA